MALGKRGVIALAAAGTALGLGLIASGVAMGALAAEDAANAQAAAAFAEARAEVDAAAEDRDAAAEHLVETRETAVAARAAAAALVTAADPGMLEPPAARDALAASVEALATVAGLTVAADGAVTAPAPPAPARVPVIDPPQGREAQLAAVDGVLALAEPFRAESEALGKETAAIQKATTAVERDAAAVVAAAHAKGAGLSVPELASDETKGSFASAVAALQKPPPAADRAALVAAYQDAWAALLASSDEAARNQDPSTIQPTYINGILVVNKTYGLPSWFGDGLTGETLSAFYAMQADAASLGYDLYISSGFRSYWDQAAIYNRYVSQDGQAEADRYSARPGHSEHQSGLTFDLNCICEGFGYSAEGQWVAANAHLYGFIVRYPEGKEWVTGYIWEPWHLRYLGVEVATAVYNSGLSLEEYLGITSSYG